MRFSIIYYLILLTVCGIGETYYVDPVNGNNSNNGNTTNAPWQTVYYATRTFGGLQPGDTIYLRSGEYTGITNMIDLGAVSGVNGTSENPITVAAYPGESPVITGILREGYRGVIIKNLNWWVFDGITYSNCYGSVWMENCTNFVWKNCTFGWMPQGLISNAYYATYAGFNIQGDSQFNTVSNCLFTNWGCVTLSGNDNGVSISIGNETADNPMWYNLIVSNRFFHGGHDNLQLNTAYNVIRGNLFVNDAWITTNETSYVLHRSGYPDEINMYGAYGNRNTKPGDAGTSKIDMRNVFEGNKFLYTGPPPDDGGADNIHIGTAWSIYRFNTFAFALRGGIDILSVSASSHGRSNAIYGNTVYGNGQSIVFGGEIFKGGAGGITTEHTASSNNLIVNNIAWGNYLTNIDGYTKSYQLLRSNWNGDDPLFSDPKYVSTNGNGYIYNPSNLPDFCLQSGSPCIDAGTWLAYITSESGSGTTLEVDNSLYFSDGNRIVAGDAIKLQGQTVTAIVVSNDWQNNTLYLDSSLTWTNGQGVSLDYNGTAPDVGAYEYGNRATIAWSGVTNQVYPAPWTNSATATYGTNTVEGEFAYSITNDTVLTVGLWTNTITFTPADTNEYTITTLDVEIDVDFGDPVFVVTNYVSSVSHPAVFSTNYVYGYSSVESVITYVPTPGTALPIGNNSIQVFCVPTDTNYFSTNIQASLTVIGSVSGKGIIRFGVTGSPNGKMIWK